MRYLSLKYILVLSCSVSVKLMVKFLKRKQSPNNSEGEKLYALPQKKPKGTNI